MTFLGGFSFYKNAKVELRPYGLPPDHPWPQQPIHLQGEFDFTKNKKLPEFDISTILI
jgi:hypothetical protein